MLYSEFKVLTRSLLTSDYPLPDDDDSIRALLGMAYNYIANKCNVLNLLTLDKSSDVVRLSHGSYVVRKPELPHDDSDELDIDNDLCYVASSLVASYLSTEKAALHQSRADIGIRDYNAKVAEILESISIQEGGVYGY